VVNLLLLDCNCFKHALAVSSSLVQPSVTDNCQHCEVQANGPDAYSPPPDARRDEDATGDIPDEPEPETDVPQAERVVQDQLSARFVTHQR